MWEKSSRNRWSYHGPHVSERASGWWQWAQYHACCGNGGRGGWYWGRRTLWQPQLGRGTPAAPEIEPAWTGRPDWPTPQVTPPFAYEPAAVHRHPPPFPPPAPRGRGLRGTEGPSPSYDTNRKWSSQMNPGPMIPCFPAWGRKKIWKKILKKTSQERKKKILVKKSPKNGNVKKKYKILPENKDPKNPGTV